MLNSIRVRLTVSFVGLAVVPLLLVGLALGWQSFRVQQQQARTLQSEVAQRVSVAVESFIQRLQHELLVVVEIQGLRGLSSDRQKGVLAELLAYEDFFEELVFLDAEGRELIRLSRLELVTEDELSDRSQSDEFIAPKASGESYYSPIWFDEATGEPLMTVAVPLFDPQSGLVDGVLAADARIKKIWELIASIRMGEGEDVYIVDAQRRVIAHHNPSVVLRGTRFDVPDQDGIHVGLNENRVVLASDRIKFGGQTFDVVAEKDVFQALNLAISTVGITTVLTVIALVVAISLGFLAMRQIVRPIETLSTTAQAVAAGDLTRQTTVVSRDEIGRLGEAFNIMTVQLRQTLEGLEQRVATRTRDLEHRSLQIQAAAEVGGAVASIRDLDDLLTQVTYLISERFGYYHVGIFLIDTNKEYVVLRAANSEGGRKMLARGHKLKVGEQGIVGYVTSAGEARIALDVGEDAVHFKNPLLPDTHSEMALPLAIGDKIWGALDIQSRERAAFSEEDVEVLEILSNLVAVAIENARLFAESQAALEAERRAYGEISRDAWLQLLRSRTNWGYRYDRVKVTPAEGACSPEMLEAAGAEQVFQKDDAGRAILAMPLEVHDQVMGVLRLSKGSTDQEWTDGEISLLGNLVDQLSIAMESARLYEDTQRRASRERLVGEIASRMRQTLDIDAVLKTVVREIGERLEIPEVEVRIGEV